MEFGIEVLPTSQMQATGDPPDRQRRFAANPRCQRQLGRVALGPLFQVRLRPPQPLQLFPDDPLGLGFGALPLQIPGVMLP